MELETFYLTNYGNYVVKLNGNNSLNSCRHNTAVLRAQSTPIIQY